MATVTDAKQIVELSILWAETFSRRLDTLEATGRIQRSKSDRELFIEAIWGEISPVEIAKEKAKETILERYAKQFAVLLERAKPAIAGLAAFFTPSQTATDLDELELVNQSVQQRISARLAPYLKPDLDALIQDAARKSQPSIVRP